MGTWLTDILDDGYSCEQKLGFLVLKPPIPVSCSNCQMRGVFQMARNKGVAGEMSGNSVVVDGGAQVQC